jgi:hypothetical protein
MRGAIRSGILRKNARRWAPLAQANLGRAPRRRNQHLGERLLFLDGRILLGNFFLARFGQRIPGRRHVQEHGTIFGRLGSPGKRAAFLRVGAILGHFVHFEERPCFRVLNKNGRIGDLVPTALLARAPIALRDNLGDAVNRHQAIFGSALASSRVSTFADPRCATGETSEGAKALIFATESRPAHERSEKTAVQQRKWGLLVSLPGHLRESIHPARTQHSIRRRAIAHRDWHLSGQRRARSRTSSAAGADRNAG